MKKSLKSLIAVLLLLPLMTATIVALPNMQFSIINKTSFVVGTVTIYNNDGVPTKIDVPGSGTFSATIAGGVAAAVINNQSIPKNGQSVDVKLASGFVVQVTLTGSQIVIIDESIVSGDKKPHGH